MGSLKDQRLAVWRLGCPSKAAWKMRSGPWSAPPVRLYRGDRIGTGQTTTLKASPSASTSSSSTRRAMTSRSPTQNSTRGYVVLKNTGPRARWLTGWTLDDKTQGQAPRLPLPQVQAATRPGRLHPHLENGLRPESRLQGYVDTLLEGNHYENACKEYGHQHRGEDDDPPQYDASNGESSASLAPS
jgi:hypothetical protein